MTASNDQQLIIYNRGGVTRVYTTAYTDEQVRSAIIRCVERYGKTAAVRSIPAAKLPPAEREDVA